MSDTEDLSLPLASQKSTLPKKKSNINKEPKKDMIIHLLKQKKKIVGNILSRAGKVSKSKSRKYKNYYNILNNQGYTFEEWEEAKSDYDDEELLHIKSCNYKDCHFTKYPHRAKKTLPTSTKSEAHQKQKPT